VTISELKVAAFSCQIDDLVVSIWPYQIFNALQSDRRSDSNTVHSLMWAPTWIMMSGKDYTIGVALPSHLSYFYHLPIYMPIATVMP